MKLISSREAVEFLSQAAPRPWVHRLLRWMAFDQEITGYSTSGKVQPYSTVFEFTAQLYDKAGEFSGEKMDAEIRREYPSEVAERLVGKEHHDRYDDEPVTWDDSEGPNMIDPGFFLYADDIDWTEGTMRCDWLNPDGELGEVLFPNDGVFSSEFQRPHYDAIIYGLSFQFNEIELLLPNLDIGQRSGFSAENTALRRKIGRRPKWDWDGAMAFVVSQAQTPDGLPTGAGAQARIEEMIAKWFIDETGDSPSTSQVRLRAAKIIGTLERPK